MSNKKMNKKTRKPTPKLATKPKAEAPTPSKEDVAAARRNLENNEAYTRAREEMLSERRELAEKNAPRLKEIKIKKSKLTRGATDLRKKLEAITSEKRKLRQEEDRLRGLGSSEEK